MSDNDSGPEEWIGEPRGYWEIVEDVVNTHRKPLFGATALVNLVLIFAFTSGIAVMFGYDIWYIELNEDPFGGILTDTQLLLVASGTLVLCLWGFVRSATISLRSES